MKIYVSCTANLGDFFNSFPVISGISKSVGQKIHLLIRPEMRKFVGIKELISYQAFVESVDEFRTGVAELVKFDNMNVFSENVEWSGKIQELDLEFFYTINEPQGIYINAQMVKVDESYLEMINKLQSYYEKFKNKWSKIVASRQEKK